MTSPGHLVMVRTIKIRIFTRFRRLAEGKYIISDLFLFLALGVVVREEFCLDIARNRLIVREFHGERGRA
jgi:hypothetical protein